MKPCEVRKALCIAYAATFGWLCVETLELKLSELRRKAATFGWLCVETIVLVLGIRIQMSSHLRVAVC